MKKKDIIDLAMITGITEVLMQLQGIEGVATWLLSVAIVVVVFNWLN